MASAYSRRSPTGDLVSRVWTSVRPLLGVLVVLTAVRFSGGAASAQELFFDFDDTGPTIEDEILDFFMLLGFEPEVGFNWTIEPNLVNPDDPSNALRTNSDGNQLANYFSRAAILLEPEAEDVEISADITWDDNDNVGLYVRFNGESHDPLGNEYYFVRVGIDNGPPSTIDLHRVKAGVHETLTSVTNAPFPVSQGDTHRLAFRAVGAELYVWIDGEPVPGMDPFVDPDPLEGDGLVGVGQETNPAYFDNLSVLTEFPCTVGRSFSQSRYRPGETVTVTLTARDLRGPTTLTETLPPRWTVSDAGGGAVNGNTIALTMDADGEVSYAVTAPVGACEEVAISGKAAGAGGCETDVGGDSVLRCTEPDDTPRFFDFDTAPPTTNEELLGFFDLLGFDPNVRSNWSIDQNLQNPDDSSNALHSISDGNQLESYFSRVAIVTVFEAENVEISADITWDDMGGDANDNTGLYVRFNGSSNNPNENEYYFVRIAVDNGPPSTVDLHRVRDGVHEVLVSATNEPFPVSEGDTVNVVFRADDDQLFVLLDGEPVPGMDPYVDFEPLTGAGRVGVGQETNPSYFDNIRITPEAGFQPFPCVVRRTISPAYYVPGDTLDVTIEAKSLQGDTSITETFPAGLAVGDAGGGEVAGNTITFNLAADEEISYTLTVPDGFCEAGEFSGGYTGAGDNCEGETRGASTITCAVGCDELHDSGGVPAVLIIGPIEAGRDTNASGLCDDQGPDGNLETLDYLDDGEGTSEETLEVVFGDEIAPDFGGAAAGLGVGFAVNPGINPDAGNGVLTVWLAQADANGFIRFDDAENVGALDDYIIYSLAYLENTTDEALNVTLEVGSDDAIKVLLNGDQVWFNAVCRGIPAYGSGDRVPVTLEPDVNTVLIAIVERGGDTAVRLVVRDEFDAPLADGSVVACLAPRIETVPTATLKPGDVNGDGGLNIADAVAHLGFLFSSGPVPECYVVPGSEPVVLNDTGLGVLDFNGDGGSNIADAVGSLNFLFASGPSHARGEECVELEGTCTTNCP